MANSRYFTFGQSHMTNFELRNGGRLADYWVRVTLPEGMNNHRSVFMSGFTELYCPSKIQFAFEYLPEEFEPEWFPRGELCEVTENGVAVG